MVGLVGSSNNPVSGMAACNALIATIILKATGKTGIQGDDNGYLHRYGNLYHCSNGRRYFYRI